MIPTMTQYRLRPGRCRIQYLEPLRSVGSTIEYMPDPNYFGPDIIYYEATDGAYSDVAEIVVSVASVNDVPVAGADSVTTLEDTAVSFDPRSNDTDVENDPLTIIAIPVSPSNGGVTFTGTSVTYTPNANFNGNDSFDYRIADGNGGEHEATVTVSITSVPDVPVAGDDSITTNEDTSLDFDPLVNDSDPDGLTLTIISATNPSIGGVTLISGNTELRYTPSTNLNGSTHFFYTVFRWVRYSDCASRCDDKPDQ